MAVVLAFTILIAFASIRINGVDSTTATPLRIISRSEWKAEAPTKTPIPLKLPVPQIGIDTTSGYKCTTQAECMSLVREYQKHGIRLRGLGDIADNFLIGGDGAVYVGRGWDHQCSSSGYVSSKTISIAFIGSYHNDEPSERQIHAAQGLIELGIKLKKVSPNYILNAQMSKYKTGLYNVVKQWPHFIEHSY